MLMSSRRLNWVELVLYLQYDIGKAENRTKQGYLCYFTVYGVEIGVVIWFELCCEKMSSGFSTTTRLKPGCSATKTCKGFKISKIGTKGILRSSQ